MTQSTNSRLKEALGDAEFNWRLAAMRRLDKWGNEPELLTASRVVQRRIFVWTNGACRDPYNLAVHLSYENNNHYNLFIVEPYRKTSRPSLLASPSGSAPGGADKFSVKGRDGHPAKRPRDVVCQAIVNAAGGDGGHLCGRHRLLLHHCLPGRHTHHVSVPHWRPS